MIRLLKYRVIILLGAGLLGHTAAMAELISLGTERTAVSKPSLFEQPCNDSYAHVMMAFLGTDAGKRLNTFDPFWGHLLAALQDNSSAMTPLLKQLPLDDVEYLFKKNNLNVAPSDPERTEKLEKNLRKLFAAREKARNLVLAESNQSILDLEAINELRSWKVAAERIQFTDFYDDRIADLHERVMDAAARLEAVQANLPVETGKVNFSPLNQHLLNRFYHGIVRRDPSALEDLGYYHEHGIGGIITQDLKAAARFYKLSGTVSSKFQLVETYLAMGKRWAEAAFELNHQLVLSDQDNYFYIEQAKKILRTLNPQQWDRALRYSEVLDNAVEYRRSDVSPLDIPPSTDHESYIQARKKQAGAGYAVVLSGVSLGLILTGLAYIHHASGPIESTGIFLLIYTMQAFLLFSFFYGLRKIYLNKKRISEIIRNIITRGSDIEVDYL